ncbi:hypothetical protein TFLX_04317 [Thermoflexales bacterium]|nr:hypothetical protein TFLX_04317 [Thermoflexales bacterium]
MRRRISTLLKEHQTFLWLWLAFLTLRVLSLIALRPGGFIANEGPDQTYYFNMARLAGSGQIPFFNFWMEYPPLMPWLAALAYRLSLAVAPWGTAIFAFNLIFRLFMLPFEAVTLIAVYGVALYLPSRDKALSVAALWALLFAPLFAFLTWFDSITLCGLIVGLYAILSYRPILAGGALGLGLMAKVMPIVIWPIGWLAFKSLRQRVSYVISTIVVVGAIVLPPLIAAPQYVLSMVRSLSSVSSWETIWAFLEGYSGYGLVAPLAVRSDPATAQFAIHPSTLPWPIITVIFGVIYVGILTRPIDWRDRSKVALGALFSFSLFVLYNKGYSPQWATYLGTLALLVLPTGRGLGYALLLGGALVAEWPIGFVMFENQPDSLALIVIVRTIIIVALCLESISRLLPAARVWRGLQRGLLPFSVSVSIAGVLIAAGPLWTAYRDTRLQAEPLAPWIEAQRATDMREPIVVLQPELFERLTPYLPIERLHQLPNVRGTAWVTPDEWLTQTLTAEHYAWFAYDAGLSKNTAKLAGSIGTWFDRGACLTDQHTYQAINLRRFALTPLPPVQSIAADFQGGLRLNTATVPEAVITSGVVLCLHVTWQAAAALPTDHALFVHLLNEQGQLIAQSDVWPEVPASQWPAALTFTTRHAFDVPRDLPPGDYRLEVGAYDIANGQRLLLQDGGESVQLTNLIVK